MEEIKPQPDSKIKPSQEEKIDHFLVAWRNSDFYKFVLQIIDNELNADHLKEAMFKAISDGTPLSNEEVGELAKIEFQANLRIQNIKDALI